MGAGDLAMGIGSRSAWQAGPSPDVATRRAFLDARRQSARLRYDERHASGYDREWGAISPSHDQHVRRLMELTRPRGMVLDAACGTGKYWPLVLGSGRTVVGLDQSLGMLRVAAGKHPEVPVGCVGLQELAFDGAFDAVMCVDAMENVGPEDWPLVLRGLHGAARPGACLYLTVELADEHDVRANYESARAAGEPVVPGESFDGVGYHYYPERQAAVAWLEQAGLRRIEVHDADEYRHYLLLRDG